MTRHSITKVGVFALCVLGSFGAVNLFSELVAQNAFFADNKMAAGLPSNLSYNMFINIDGTRFDLPLTSLVWFGSAYALWKNSERFAPYVGGLAFAALLTHGVLFLFIIRSRPNEFGPFAVIETAAVAFLSYVTVLVSGFLLCLKRYSAGVSAKTSITPNQSTDPAP